MGVTRTFKYVTKDFKEEILRLQNVLQIMNAQDIGSWNVNITIMHHKKTEDAGVLCLLNYQNTQIALLCSSNERHIIHGDNNLSRIIENMQCYKSRQQYIVTGVTYQLGDFIFRIGIGSIANENRCLICEVEFLGPRYISEATPSILEFMTLLDPNSQLVLIQINYDHFFKLNSEEANAKITAIDLLLCLNCISLSYFMSFL